MKYDIVITNPPYLSQQQIHQQYFNMSVDMVNDGGYVVFVQPATPYLLKKRPERFKHLMAMRDNIKKWYTTVNIISPTEYNFNAWIYDILAITVLHKVPASETVQTVVYRHQGKRTLYHDVALSKLSMHGDAPELVSGIMKKYENMVKQCGSISDIIDKNSDMSHLCRLGKIRGNIRWDSNDTTLSYHKDDFYTMVGKSADRHVYRSEDFNKGLSIYANSFDSATNVYNYLSTKLARFGLSFYKAAMSNQSGATGLIPLVDFAHSWNDEELCSLFDIDEAEWTFIDGFISDFY